MLDSESSPTEAGELSWVPLIDVSGLSITDLVGRDDSVFNRMIGQVIESLNDPNAVMSAFDSYPSP